jgi:hypothetical protein
MTTDAPIDESDEGDEGCTAPTDVAGRTQARLALALVMFGLAAA